MSARREAVEPSGTRDGIASLERFAENGYAGPFELDDRAQSDKLQDFIRGHREPGILNRILSKAGIAHDRRLQQPSGHLVFRPIFDFAVQPQLLDDVETILGPDLLLWKGRILVRESGSGGQAWHIDFDNKLVQGVHVTFAVTPMTGENGALQLIPGTHRYEVGLTASGRSGLCNLSDAQSVVAYADRLHPENAPHSLVTMELRPGQYFLTKGGLWHGVPPNRTAGPRVAVLSRYMRPDMQSKHWSHDDTEAHVVSEKSLPCMLVRGQDRFGLNRLRVPPRR